MRKPKDGEFGRCPNGKPDEPQTLERCWDVQDRKLGKIAYGVLADHTHVLAGYVRQACELGGHVVRVEREQKKR